MQGAFVRCSGMEEDGPDGNQGDGGQTETDEQKGKDARTRFGLSRFRRGFNNSPLACSGHDILHFGRKAVLGRLFLGRNVRMPNTFVK